MRMSTHSTPASARRQRYALQTTPDRTGRVVTVSHGYAGPEGAAHAARDLPLLQIAHRRPLNVHSWQASA